MDVNSIFKEPQLKHAISAKRIVMTSLLIIAVVLIAITLFSLISFSTTHQKLDKVTKQYQPKMLSAMQLTSNFYHSLSVLGNYMIQQDRYNHDLYQEKVNDIDATLNQLISLTDQFNELEDRESLNRIKILVSKIKTVNKNLLLLSKNVNKNIPAIGLAAGELEPLAYYMNNIVSDLLVSTEQNQQTRIILLIDNLRFTWSMVISETNHYLAFRNNSSLKEIDLYLDGVDQSLLAFKKETQVLDEDQMDLIAEFRNYFSEYKVLLQEVLRIHSSKKWRSDSVIMREQVSPTLRTLTAELEELVLKQQQRIKNSNLELSEQIESAESTIKLAIQIAAAVTIIVIFLALRMSFLRLQVATHKETAQQMHHKASHDSLTKIANRSFFLEQLAHKLKHIDEDYGVALFFLDLDGFKQINDTVGHDAGDYILIETAKRLKNLMRQSDIVARLGGDEFTILLDNIRDPGATKNVAQRVINTLNKDFVFNDQVLNIGCSLGIAFCDSLKTSPIDEGDEKSAASELLRMSDEAMYEAKRNGKNQYAVYRVDSETA